MNLRFKLSPVAALPSIQPGTNPSADTIGSMNIISRTNLALALAVLAMPEAAPKPGAAPKVNPFNAVLCDPSKVTFANDIKDPGKPWNDGTVSQTLAAAVIPMGATGATISTARIVRKTKTDGSVTFDVQMPSSGGSFRRPMIDVSHDDNARRNLLDWSKQVAANYIAWRKAQVAAGAASISAGAVQTGVAASSDDLTALGLA